MPEAHTSRATAGVQRDTLAGAVGNGEPFGTFSIQVPLPPSTALHHWVRLQSVATLQVMPQDLVPLLQIGPTCPTPSQSELMAQCPHSPLARHTGSPDDGQGVSAVEPRSPVHPAQSSASMSHTGVSPVQALTFVIVHCTHRLLVWSHAGVAPLQLASALQLPQVPAFAPLDTQTPERHWSAPASPAGQGLPLGVPHSLSVVLQTPLAHALSARDVVQVPPGTACPLGT